MGLPSEVPLHDRMRRFGDILGYWKLLIAIGISAILSACNEEEPKKQIGQHPAELVLDITKFRYEFVDGLHTYFHQRKYSELIGTGVTLEAGKVCVENGKACLSARVEYRIDGGKQLEQPEHHFATRLRRDLITIEYWGKDDAGNEVRIKKTVRVEGDKVEVR